MSFVGHFFINAFLGVVLTVPFFLGVNLVLFLAGYGHPRRVKFAYTVRRALRGIPPGTVLQCNGGKVSAVVYSPARDEESVSHLYTASVLSLLTWSGGPQSAKSLLSRANTEVFGTVACAALGYVPPLAFGVWLGLNESSYWFLAVAVLVTCYAVTILAGQVVILKWAAFSGIVVVVFLHRFHLYPISVVYIVSACFAIVSVAALPWVQRLLKD
jgi:hypothetical protein